MNASEFKTFISDKLDYESNKLHQCCDTLCDNIIREVDILLNRDFLTEKLGYISVEPESVLEIRTNFGYILRITNVSDTNIELRIAFNLLTDETNTFIVKNGRMEHVLDTVKEYIASKGYTCEYTNDNLQIIFKLIP